MMVPLQVEAGYAIELIKNMHGEYGQKATTEKYNNK